MIEFKDEPCIVCNEPIGDEPHDGRMNFQKGERHWKCRPDANDPIANLSFSEAIQGLKKALENATFEDWQMVRDRLRKMTK